MTEQVKQTGPGRKQKVGRVVSDKMDKTIVVAVDYLRPHLLYRKTVRKTSKFYAHDEQNAARVGDYVEIEETRPMSRLKRWRLKNVLQRAALVGTETTGAENLAPETQA